MYHFFHTRFFNTLHLKPYTLNLKKGFTLIELLIVVAIIGILSVAAFVTFSGTRGRARDAVRISDISQAQLFLLIENTTAAGSRPITGCPGVAATNARLFGACTLAFAELALLKDPNGYTNGCNGGGTVACDYSLSNSAGTDGATTGDYQICFYLEDKTSLNLGEGPGVVKAVYSATTQKLGVFSTGCT